MAKSSTVSTAEFEASLISFDACCREVEKLFERIQSLEGYSFRHEGKDAKVVLRLKYSGSHVNRRPSIHIILCPTYIKDKFAEFELSPVFVFGEDVRDSGYWLLRKLPSPPIKEEYFTIEKAEEAIKELISSL